MIGGAVHLQCGDLLVAVSSSCSSGLVLGWVCPQVWWVCIVLFKCGDWLGAVLLKRGNLLAVVFQF